MDIKELQKKIIDFRDKREWKQFNTPKDVAISLTLEASEVLEHFQWKTPEEVEKYLKVSKEEIGEELADVLWYLLTLANDIEIDISKHLVKKVKKNEKRYPIRKVKGTHKKYTEL